VGLTNFDTSQSSGFTLPLFSSGFTGAATTTVLLPGFYQAVYRLSGDTTALPVYSTFIVVGSSFNNPYQSSVSAASTTTPFCDTSGTSTANVIVRGIVSFGCFILVPQPSAFGQYAGLNDTLRTKIPFAYYYQIKDMVASSTASSSTLPTLTLYTATSSPLHMPPIVLFSAALMHTYIPDWVAALIRLTTSGAMILSLLWFIWVGVPKFFGHSKTS